MDKESDAAGEEGRAGGGGRINTGKAWVTGSFTMNFS